MRKSINCRRCGKRCPDKEQLGSLPDLWEQGEIEQAIPLLGSLKSQNLCTCEFEFPDAHEPESAVNRKEVTPWWVFYPELRHKVAVACAGRPECPYKADHMEKWMVDGWVNKQKMLGRIRVILFRVAEFGDKLLENDPAARSANLKGAKVKTEHAITVLPREPLSFLGALCIGVAVVLLGRPILPELADPWGK